MQFHGHERHRKLRESLWKLVPFVRVFLSLSVYIYVSQAVNKAVLMTCRLIESF